MPNLPRAMQTAVLATLLALACCSAPAYASDEGAGKVAEKQQTATHPIPEDLAEQVKRSENIGRILFVLDYAGAVGTDVMRANTTEQERSHLAGYLALLDDHDDGSPPTNTVYFFTAEKPARIAYTVTVGYKLEPVFKRYDPFGIPSLDLAKLFQARQSAVKALSPPQQPLNPIVLPGRMIGEEGTVVYALAGTTKPNVAVFGKHFRVVVAPDDTTVTSVTPMTKGIMEMPTRTPEGTEPVEIAVTQLLTDYPTETQVCTNRIIGMPVMVLTKRGLWKITEGHISFVMTREEMEKQTKDSAKTQ